MNNGAYQRVTTSIYRSHKYLRTLRNWVNDGTGARGPSSSPWRALRQVFCYIISNRQANNTIKRENIKGKHFRKQN